MWVSLPLNPGNYVITEVDENFITLKRDERDENAYKFRILPFLINTFFSNFVDIINTLQILYKKNNSCQIEMENGSLKSSKSLKIFRSVIHMMQSRMGKNTRAGRGLVKSSKSMRAHILNFNLFLRKH